jgi:hypothetical protein
MTRFESQIYDLAELGSFGELDLFFQKDFLNLGNFMIKDLSKLKFLEISKGNLIFLWRIVLDIFRRKQCKSLF